MAERRRRVVWTVQAQSALDEVLTYIAADSIQGARTILEQALKGAADLEVHSERGRIVPETGDPGIRELFIKKYRLMYEIAEDEVRIIAFLHGARDFARWRGQD